MRSFAPIATIAALLALSAPVCAAASPFETGLRELTLTSGYGENHRIPSSMKGRLRFDQCGFRWGEFKSPTKEIAYELSLGTQVNSQNNYAVTAVKSYRRYFAFRGRTSWAYEFAFGGARLKDKVPGQATRANFTEQAGIVMQHQLSYRTAFTIQYRFCHISNGGIKKPNVGINASTLSIGYSVFM